MSHNTHRLTRTPLTLALFLATLALVPAAAGQDTLPAPTTTRIPYRADSGPVTNPGPGWQTIYTHQVHIPAATSLRLHFAQADLPDGAFILATAMQDGEQHRLDSPTVDLWSNSTAYFNGDTVLLEVLAPAAAPGGPAARIRIETVEVSFPELPPEHPLRGDPGQCGICGTDDRIPTNLTFSARLMPVGCTASIVCEDNAAVTAGHCLNGADVMQFNVPASLGNCNLVAPPVADQFPVIAATRQGVNGGVGNDWGVFRVGANGAAAGPFQRYGQLRRIAAGPPVNGTIVQVFGYGVDTTCTRNQVQQRSVGTLTGTSSDALNFNADVRGGNSGSALLANGDVIGVVSHCSFSCGGNIATRIDLPAFRNALNNLYNCDHRVRIVGLNPSNQPVTVTVDVTPADNNGAADGSTPIDRIFSGPAAVTLTAPDAAGTLCFSHWELDGVPQTGGPVVTFNLSGIVLAAARYSADACSTCEVDWNDDSVINSSDISAFITDWLASIQNSTLVADFNGDNEVNSTDISAFITAWLDAIQNGC